VRDSVHMCNTERIVFCRWCIGVVGVNVGMKCFCVNAFGMDIIIIIFSSSSSSSSSSSIRWEDDIRKDLQTMRIENWKQSVLDRDSRKAIVERTKAQNEL
jgi:hypothetical protein